MGAGRTRCCWRFSRTKELERKWSCKDAAADLRFPLTRIKTMKNQVTPERIMQFAWGYAPTLIIEAAVHHRVFDLLDESPKTIKELAKKSGASQRGLTAIVNALVGLNFLSRKGERYALMPESATFLVSTKPAFLGALY